MGCDRWLACWLLCRLHHQMHDSKRERQRNLVCGLIFGILGLPLGTHRSSLGKFSVAPPWHKPCEDVSCSLEDRLNG